MRATDELQKLRSQSPHKREELNAIRKQISDDEAALNGKKQVAAVAFPSHTINQPNKPQIEVQSEKTWWHYCKNTRAHTCKQFTHVRRHTS